MKIHYLEIVNSNVGSVCAAYEAAHGVQFEPLDPLLGNATNSRMTSLLAG